MWPLSPVRKTFPLTPFSDCKYSIDTTRQFHGRVLTEYDVRRLTKHALESAFLQLGVVGEFNSFFIFRSEYIFYTIEPIFVEIVQELLAIQSWKSEKPVFRQFFDGFWGFLQLGVVGETSNIAHVTLAVHTFAGKKEFFKSAQYFFLFRITYKHTYVTKFKY